MSSKFHHVREEVPREGVEPSRPYGHCGLNAASIPTRVPGQKWWSRQEFNLRLPEFQSGALATELRDQERKEGESNPKASADLDLGSSQVPHHCRHHLPRGRKGNRTLQAEQHRLYRPIGFPERASPLKCPERGSNPHALAGTNYSGWRVFQDSAIRTRTDRRCQGPETTKPLRAWDQEGLRRRTFVRTV